jgi:cation diffusion facilitator CzcD-associated flavoprotein CzcO
VAGHVRLDFETAIIGAGFAGVIAALELKKTCRESFVIFERESEVGGVWRDNIYPGCVCDIRSQLYSVAARPNPDWASAFASQRDILNYLKSITYTDNLRRHIRFGTNVVELRFLDQPRCWQVTDQNGTVYLARTVIVATGPQSRPFTPALEGRTSFKGTAFHSSAWDDSVPLCGKRIAVIGTGASAVQIVPNLAPFVSGVTVFQRSAPWILPRCDRRLSAFERWVFRRIPLLQTLTRVAIYWAMEAVGLAFLGNGMLNRAITAVALAKLAREVRDPVTRKALTPDYALGCKRIMLSDDFYPAFNRTNVHLVTDGIEALTSEGIRTVDGRLHEVDHIVFATGFTVADADGFLRIVGKDGRLLMDDWIHNGPQAYLGIAIAGYPNLTMLLGPNSGLSHSSALHVIESQMNYVLQYLRELDRMGPGAALDVRSDVQSAYNDGLQHKLAGMIWASGCTSWYLSRSGRNTTIFPGLTSAFRRRTARFDPKDYSITSDP